MSQVATLISFFFQKKMRLCHLYKYYFIFPRIFRYQKLLKYDHMDKTEIDWLWQMQTHLSLLTDAGIQVIPAFQHSEKRMTAPVSLPKLNQLPQAPPVKDPEHQPVPPRDRRLLELQQLAAEVSSCRLCAELASTRSRTVFGVGPLDPDLCFVGEAPGGDEDKQGEPFVGAAGQLLTRIIIAMGMKREEIFICNILRCRPPGNRTPKTEEANNCDPFLKKTLELVRPKHIVALGATAAHHLLKTQKSLGMLRGRFYDYQGIPLVCTYHPASLLPHRSPENKKLVWEDMKMLLARMGRTVPHPQSSS